MNSAIRTLCGKYAKLKLECDGLTRVLHTVLSKHNVPHRVMVGEVIDAQSGMTVIPLHFWITLPNGYIVDYRLRMWLGGKAPNGVFKTTKYNFLGVPSDMKNLDRMMFKMLTSF